jgi:amino acid adenylation domain-containing protein
MAPNVALDELKSALGRLLRAVSSEEIWINEFTSSSDYVLHITRSEMEPFQHHSNFRFNLLRTGGTADELHFVAHHRVFDRLSMWSIVAGLENESFTAPDGGRRRELPNSISDASPIDGRALWVGHRSVERSLGLEGLSDEPLKNTIACLAAFGALVRPLALDGITMAAASQRPTPTAIGCFVRTLDVHLPFTADGTLEIGGVRTALFEANREARAETRRANSVMLSPTVAFNYNVAPTFVTKTMRMAVHDVWGAHLATHALRLDIEEHPEGWQIDLFYDPERVRAEEAERLLNDFTRNLGMPSSVRTSELSGIAPTQPFAERALNRLISIPDRPIIFDGAAHTGTDIAREAIAVANALRANIPGVENLVGVALPPSAHSLSTFLGVLLSGNIYLPLDPSLPPGHNLARIEIARPSVVISNRPFLPTDIDGVDQITFSEIQERIGHHAPAPVNLSAQSIAYQLFTSGSTGSPKIVNVSLQNLEYLTGVVRVVKQEIVAKQANGADLLSMHVGASSAFDAHVWEYVLVLEGGFVGHVASNLDLDAWKENLQSVDVITAVPSMLALVSEESSLPRTIISVGEKLAPMLADSLMQKVQLYNAYGPAEATICSTFGAIQNSRDLDSVVGRPLSGSAIYILDPTLTPVPAGSVGEVYIGGRGVSLGYREDPLKTAAAFLPDPFASASSARMYRTGDHGAITESGNLQILGRVDDQVKIAGQRVELSEVRDHLISHELVKDAVAIAVDMGTGREVVAFVEPDSPRENSLAEIWAWIQKDVPRWARPASLQIVSEVPRLPSGKADREALRALTRVTSSERKTSSSLKPPQGNRDHGDLVEFVRAEWEEVLARSTASNIVVAPQSNVFDLGASSLDVARFAWRMSEHRLKATVESVYMRPVISDYALHLERDSTLKGFSTIGTSVSEDARTPLPGSLRASPLQSQLYFLWKLDPGDTTYNIPMVYAVAGHISPEQLQASLLRVQARQPALRTSLVEREGQVLLEVPSVVEHPIVVELEHTDGLTEARRRAAELVRLPFNLEVAPLVRVWLISYAGGQLLVISAHHSVFDAESASMLFQELAEAYEQNPKRRSAISDFTPAPQRDLFANTDAYDRRSLLEIFPRTRIDVGRLLVDRGGRAERTVLSDEGVVRVRLEESVTRAINTASLRYSVSHYALVLASFARLVWDELGYTDIAITSPMSYRRSREDAELVGCLVDSSVVRLNLPKIGATPASETVRQAQRAVINVLDRPWLSMASLKRILQREGLSDRLPELSLQVIRAPLKVTLGVATLTSQAPPPVGARQRLQIQISEDDDLTLCDVMFNPNEFTNEQVGGLVGSFVRSLRDLTAELLDAEE